MAYERSVGALNFRALAARHKIIYGSLPKNISIEKMRYQHRSGNVTNTNIAK